MLTVINDRGTPFNVRLVKKGEKYGLKDCLTHDKADPLIEFYDATTLINWDYNRGQFVARYNLSTLIDSIDKGCGLCLYGGEPSWYITEQNKLDALVYAGLIMLDHNIKKDSYEDKI